jgi:hypothetical protein
VKNLKKEDAEKAISQLLVGATLDSFRVFSTVLLVGFYRSDNCPELPNEIWLSSSGKMTLINSMEGRDAYKNEDENFFAQRAFLIGKLFETIGSSVEAVAISPLGVPSIGLGGREIRCEPDEENFEEIWAVMSDSPDASADHRFYIALEDTGKIGGQFK